MGPNCGTAKVWVSRPMMEVPTPIAIKAEMSGSRAHRKDRRKAKNSTIRAKMIPRPSLEDCRFCSLFSMALPPSWTLRTELSADWAVSISSVTASFGTFWARASR